MVKKSQKVLDKMLSCQYNMTRALGATRLRMHGSIAQLGEHMPYKHGVTGSSPVVPTNLALWCSRLARQPVTLEVDGSSPFGVAI